MALTTYDLPTLIAQCRAYFRAQFPAADQSDSSYHGQLSAVLAMVLLEAQNELQQVDQDWPPSGSSYTPGRQSSTAALDQAAFTFGLPDSAGGFGRRVATISSGGETTFTAPSGTVFPDGMLMVDVTGQVTCKLSGAVTSSPFGFIDGKIVSVTTGAVANLPVGAVLTIQSPPPGASPTVTLFAGLSGGQDIETDEELLTRIYDRLQQPRTGGRSADWKDWLSGIQAIKQVYIYPRRSGTGMVDSVVAIGGSGASRIPSAAVLAEATAAYATRRNACAQVNVLYPRFASNRDLTIRSLAIPTLPKYAWDWVSSVGTTGYQITAFTVGSPSILEITGDITVMSPSLTAAITAGKKPRIQVALKTGNPTLPWQVPVVAYQVVAGPITKLSLGTLPAGWNAPVLGDFIVPGGPLAVNQIDPLAGPIHRSPAQRVLDYIDLLGPSRQSGYADNQYYWDDTARWSVIKQTIIDTTDLDGTPMVRSTGNSALSDTTIQVGGGMPAALDVTALDASPGAPPEMLKAVLVVVTGP